MPLSFWDFALFINLIFFIRLRTTFLFWYLFTTTFNRILAIIFLRCISISACCFVIVLEVALWFFFLWFWFGIFCWIWVVLFLHKLFSHFDTFLSKEHFQMFISNSPVLILDLFVRLYGIMKKLASQELPPIICIRLFRLTLYFFYHMK